MIFWAALISLVAVSAICSALLGTNKGTALMLVLLAIGGYVAFKIVGEGALYLLGYGGGFILIACGIGIGIGTRFRKKAR
jgi:hypothetical protein